MEKKKEKSYSTLFIVLGLALFCVFVVNVVTYANQCTEYTYSLSEVDDDVYAIYYTTHSRVPAENYEVVVLCCNGNVCTFNGNVYITFIEGEPYAKVEDYNIVHGDKIYVYIPKGTVSYRESVNISK